MQIKIARLAAAAMLLLAGAQALAEDVSPQDEYEKRLKLARTIQPLGEAPFGENYSFLSGELSFQVTDIELTGTGPTITLSRSVGSREPDRGNDALMLGNWDLSIPRIDTMVRAASRLGDVGLPGENWKTSTGGLARCSQIGQLGPEEWWHGYEFVTPTGSRLNLLKRDVANTAQPTVVENGVTLPVPIVTQGNWQIACLPNTSNGEVGEAFLAIAPDGTKYYLDYLTGVRAPTVAEFVSDSLRSAPGDGESEEEEGEEASAGDGVVTPLAGPIRRFHPRMFASMYVSKVVDRFGNWVQYQYTGRKISTITASDGRAVSFTWRSDAPVIASITVQPGAEQRVWTYTTTASQGADGYWGASLGKVTLPDNSAWSYLQFAKPTALTRPVGCGTIYGDGTVGDIKTLVIAHPSGMTGSFTLQSKWYGRSYVPSNCMTDSGLPIDEGVPAINQAAALTQKTFTGPGLTPMTWSYVYSTPEGSYTRDPCASAGTCLGTRWVDVIEPDSSKRRYTINTRFGLPEGRTVSVDTYSAAGALLNRELPTYAAHDAGPYPARLGDWLGGSSTSSFEAAESMAPLQSRTVIRDGVTFTWSVPAVPGFDKFARPLAVQKSSSLGTRSESTTYYDDEPHWVLGQVATQTIEGTLVAETSYTALAQPQQVKSFGAVRQSFTYHPDGNLATVKDGNNNITTVSNWKRGVPQLVQFADTQSVAAQVDDFGQIRWVEDENDSRTCYAYDVMGRLTSVTYPSETAANTCNASKWQPTTFTWEWINVAEHGLAAGHWLRREHTGNHRRNTFYDVMYRPVLVHFYDGANTSATLQTTGSTYDAQGRVTFASYPAGTLEKGSTGVWTEYDALGRVTSTSQDSELGPLTTLTQYLTGFKTQVTNPKLQVTTTSYQAFGEPSTDAPVLIEHPGSTFTHITRDLFGKPSKIRRSNSISPTGGTVALDRDYYYNAKQELCRSVEPETGATLMGYDDAGNLSWSAAGLPMSTVCTDAATAAVTSRKATRTYDSRNRLGTLNFPDGKGDQVWTYTATSKPATITTYNGSAQTQPVVNTYTYNRRGLLSFETSAQTGWYSWGLGYVYDTFANLHTVNYADGLSIVYAPNAIGQPTQAGPYASNISYHRNGALKQFTYGNGIVHTMSQNARQLPARSTDSGGVLDLGYVYDGNANVSSITDYTTGGNQSRTLSYDTLDRLTQAVGPSFGTATYAYNVLDDITRLTVTGGNKPRDHVYNYSTGTHQLETVNNYVGGAAVIGLLYDEQGNLKNKNGQTYDFDFGNRLRNVPGKETYRYDGHGRRVYSFTTTHAVWQYSNAGQLMYSHDNRNNRKTNYVYLQGSLLAMREAPMSGGDGTYTVKYQHTDALGSPIKVTDAAGLTVETSEYEPYGHLANRALTDGPGFTGHVQDAGTGLTYMQQRYYDPQVGRFLSVDPITAYSQPTSNFNRHFYANSQPYRFLDPDGRQASDGYQLNLCGLSGCESGSFGSHGGVNARSGSQPSQADSEGAYGHVPNQNDPAWTRDPNLLAQMEDAWADSNPGAPIVLGGMPGSQKMEQGGWVVQFFGSDKPQLVRSDPGTRASMGTDVLTKPSQFVCGCRVLGFFHTHPNTFAEGYRARANGHDYQFLLDVGVSGMIRSQEGYEYIPIPGER